MVRSNSTAKMANGESSCTGKDPLYSRKDKSLGLLCTNFFRLYDRDGVDSIGLDAAALQLGVERRRIYDIVNILESVGVLQRKGKNQYTWKGFGAVPNALQVLKEQGLQEKFDTYVANVANLNECGGVPSSSSTDGGGKGSESDKESKREKSLGLLTQNFVKLFLCLDVDVISLDRAALALLGDSDKGTAMRTKIRRLYDIANVFSSMELIEKIRHPETGKPAFRWTGMVRSFKVASATVSNVKSSKRRAFGADITNLPEKRCNTNSLSGLKLHETTDMEKCTKLGKNKQPTKNHQKYGSKDFVFGPFAPPSVTNTNENHNQRATPDWENLSQTYRPQYCNQAVNELVQHYAQALRSWYVEAEEKQLTKPGS